VRTSEKKVFIFATMGAISEIWELRPVPQGRGKHARRDSNPQPTVLETATLPIELPPFAFEQSLVP
jgi:hypothetical protein